MAISIETTEDLLRALRENEEFLAAARREIYTQDLLALPREFRGYSEKTDARLENIDGVDALQDDMNDMQGFNLERKMAFRLRQQLGRAFELTTVRAIWTARSAAQATGRARTFERQTEEASENGVISYSEADRLIDTDMIVSGMRMPGGDAVYIAVEASGTIKTNDIDRARESASILTRLYETEAIAAVYGYSIEQQQVDEAQPDTEADLPEVHIFLESDRA